MEEKTLKIIAATVIVVLVGISLFTYFFPSLLPAWGAQRQAAEEGVQNTYSWDNAVQEYEWFKDQKHTIAERRKQIENYQQQEQEFHDLYGNNASEWERTTRIRHGRLHDRVVGAQNDHDRLVEEYNSRAEQAHRAIFMCGLPYEMEKKFWLGDGRPDDSYEEDSSEEIIENPEECTDLKEIAQEPPQ